MNLDEQSDLQTARQIINKYELKWPQIMSGQGEADREQYEFLAGQR
jgi:hypothetical protein